MKADNALLESRVRELQEQLGAERAAQLRTAAQADQYRRDAQRMFAQQMAKSFDPTDWENVDLSRYTLTIADLLAEVDKLPE